MEYQTILTIKESEKATVLLAAVEAYVGPVVVKKLKGGKSDIYHLLRETSHPNISQIISVEETEEGLLVAEEYVDGENLAECLQKHYLSDDEKINLALQLCDAVGFLHAMKPSVIHRDIKPSNILITKKGVLKLIDFDASRQYKDMPSSSDTRLLGTVEYAPPEQFGYSQTDVRSDIYSMGVVFHEMRPTENKKVAELWEKISEKCTSFDPKNRYQSVAELKKELEKLSAWKKRRKKKLLAGICGVAVACFAVVLTVFLWPKKNQAEEAGGTVPTSAVTEAPTPEPTETPTPTPEPTATSTPVPTETPTPEPASTMTSELDPFAEAVKAQGIFVEKYYKASGRDYMNYSTMYEGESVKFSVMMYSPEKNKNIRVPEDCIYNENNVLHIKNSYFQELDAGYYYLSISYLDEATGRGDSWDGHVLLCEEFGIEETAGAIINDCLDFYYEYNKNFLHTLIANSSEARFAEGDYTVLEDGRVIELSYEYLMQYMDPGKEGTIELQLPLEDGRLENIEVYYKLGKPPYVQ